MCKDSRLVSVGLNVYEYKRGTCVIALQYAIIADASGLKRAIGDYSSSTLVRDGEEHHG